MTGHPFFRIACSTREVIRLMQGTSLVLNEWLRKHLHLSIKCNYWDVPAELMESQLHD